MRALAGARAVRTAIVDRSELGGVHQWIVWIPMLDSDERPAADEVSRMFAPAWVPPFRDGCGQRLGANTGQVTPLVWFEPRRREGHEGGPASFAARR